MASLLKRKNTGEGSLLRKGSLVVGLVLTVLIFSGIGFAVDIMPDRYGSNTLIIEPISLPLGHLKSGVVIHGSYHVQHGSVNFFIVNEGNYSRWSDGLSYDAYSQMGGMGGSFSFTVPHEDEWYAVFQNAGWGFPPFEYGIHIGFPGIITVAFAIPGIIVAIIIGIAFIVGGRLEPTFEPTTRPIYGEEIKIKEVEPRIPEFICPECGHGNPRDADFCVGCGQDLDLADDVSR